jgi:hypothetical protein
MNNHRLLCPKCHTKSGVLTEEVSKDDERAEHIPEGLSGFTTTQCESCFHEWNVVTRRQVVQSLRLWNAHPTGGMG